MRLPSTPARLVVEAKSLLEAVDAMTGDYATDMTDLLEPSKRLRATLAASESASVGDDRAELTTELLEAWRSADWHYDDDKPVFGGVEVPNLLSDADRSRLDVLFAALGTQLAAGTPPARGENDELRTALWGIIERIESMRTEDLGVALASIEFVGMLRGVLAGVAVDELTKVVDHG